MTVHDRGRHDGIDRPQARRGRQGSIRDFPEGPPFLADPAQTPHLRSEDLAELLGVRQATMANKGRLIMDTVRIGLMDPEYSRQALIAHNPMVWMLEIDGFIVDARRLPEALQIEAWRRGLIPYVPAHAENG